MVVRKRGAAFAFLSLPSILPLWQIPQKRMTKIEEREVVVSPLLARQGGVRDRKFIKAVAFPFAPATFRAAAVSPAHPNKIYPH